MGRGLSTVEHGIEALKRQTDAVSKQVDTNARLETERQKTECLRIRLEELREKNHALQHRQMMRLLAGILLIVGGVVEGLLWTGDSSKAVTVLTTTVVGILSLFAGKGFFGERPKRDAGEK